MKDFDELLDEVLREDSQVEPRLGMERRVLAVVRTKSSRKRWPRVWWVPAGVCAGMVLGVVLMMQYRLHESAGSVATVVMDGRTHPSVGYESPMATVKDAPVRHEMKRSTRGSALPVERTEEVAEDRLPKMDTFPAVTQRGGFWSEPTSGSGAKELREVVDSPQVAEALQGLKKEQERPLVVSAIEIKPL
jgi:hypothetical protein